MNKKSTLLYILLAAFVVGTIGCTILTVDEVEGILPGTWQTADDTRTLVFNADKTYTDTNNETDAVVNGTWKVTTVGAGGIEQTTLELCNAEDVCVPYPVGITAVFSDSNMTLTLLGVVYSKQ